MKSESDDDRTAAVEEAAVENRTAEMKGGCSVGDGARTRGGAPLVPFRVVVTLSETERVLQLVLREGFRLRPIFTYVASLLTSCHES